MGHLDLARDPKRGFYSVPGMIRKLPGAPTGSGAPFVNLEFFVDTGSNQTIISEDVAAEIGVDLARVERRNASGIGGWAAMPVVTNLEVWILEPAAGPIPLKLPQVSVMENRERHDRIKKGPIIKTRDGRMQGVSLLGLDALEILKATLTVRPHESFAALDW
jgi:aspartyl protease